MKNTSAYEILAFGNIELDFKRLGVKAKNTYKSENNKYKVFELDNSNFFKLCNDESDDIEGVWLNSSDCSLGIYNDFLEVKGQDLNCWFENKTDDENYRPTYDNLFSYIDNELNIKNEWEMCEALKTLARYNNISLSELLNNYQG